MCTVSSQLCSLVYRFTVVQSVAQLHRCTVGCTGADMSADLVRARQRLAGEIAGAGGFLCTVWCTGLQQYSRLYSCTVVQ